MIAIDTNILVYAHRADSRWHQSAAAAIRGLVNDGSSWAIPWPCIHEFLAVTTHARIYAPPSPIDRACAQIDAWLGAPGVVLLAERQDYWTELRSTVMTASSAGPRVHDARIAALCAHHGVRELWSADRDFGRFAGVRVVNPLTRG